MTSQSARIEIAREIHDGIAQDLVALGYRLDAVLAAPGTPASFRNEVRTIRFTVSDLIEKGRAEIFNLRNCGDFPQVIQALIAEIDFNIQVRGLDTNLTEEQSELLLRVIPELMRNAVNHSGATQICLGMDEIDNRLMVTISDNGKGGATLSAGHYGIQGCIERVEKVGGSMDIQTGKAGTTITIAL